MKRLALAAALAVSATLSFVSPASADERVGFTSPDGEIGCLMDPWSVRCDIRTRSWTPPPRAVGCPADMGWGQGIMQNAGDPNGASFVCAWDSVLMSGDPLGYGEEMQLDSIRCQMPPDGGVACQDFMNGKGFSMSAQGYQIY